MNISETMQKALASTIFAAKNLTTYLVNKTNSTLNAEALAYIVALNATAQSAPGAICSDDFIEVFTDINEKFGLSITPNTTPVELVYFVYGSSGLSYFHLLKNIGLSEYTLNFWQLLVDYMTKKANYAYKAQGDFNYAN